MGGAGGGGGTGVLVTAAAGLLRNVKNPTAIGMRMKISARHNIPIP